MKKTSASIFLAFILDLIFILFFSFVLMTFKKENEEIILHMNQVGMFKEIENRDACIKKLENIGLNGYSYKKDDLLIVVTSIQLEKNKSIDEQKILKSNNITYILKEITTQNPSIVQAMKENNIPKVLELMSK